MHSITIEDHNRYQTLLHASFEKVVEASVPQNCLVPYLPEPHTGKTYVVGAGKAAAKMAQVFERHYKGVFEGIVITRYGFVAKTETIQVIEAAHPNPDENGCDGAKEILKVAERATCDDVVICLLSGGGSSLLSCPHEEIDFKEYQDLNDQLLKCGASIYEMNCVRKHLNRLFGGKLAQAVAPARLITLAISDVAGDDVSTIASGPTVGDITTLEDAKSILKKYNLNVGGTVSDFLAVPENETLNPDNPVFSNTSYHLIATPEKSLQAAVAFFKEHDIEPHVLSSEFEGDTNECAFFHAKIVQRILQKNQPFKKPCVLISGGETTVKVSGTGQGGPNTQFMLKMALELNSAANVYALACDTDGIDGCMDNAGAIITPKTLEKAICANLNAQHFLEDNDSYNFFEKLGDLINPGPTHTNVNDYRAILIV